MTRAALVVAACLALLPAPASAQAPRAAETFDAVWRIVRDTHFDKTYNGVDWDAARETYRPKALAAATASDLRSVLREMLALLGQSHFSILPATADAALRPGGGGSAHTGFDVRLIGSDFVVIDVEEESGASAAGVQRGWRITAFDGTPAAQLLAPLKEAEDPRVRALEAWRIAQGYLRGASGTSVNITFEDADNKPRTLTVTRQQEKGQPVTVGNLPTMYVRVTSESHKTPAGQPVGVIGFNVWMAAVDALFQKAVDEHRNAAGIVIDLRGNPGGLAGMLMGIAGHFIDERKPLGTMKMRESELHFTVNPRLVNARGERVSVFSGPVAVLVDTLTGSASECFTGGMQSLDRVKVFGQTSMGAALPSQFEQLPNGDVFIHATADFVTADGTRLEGRGVIPDEDVPLTREDLLAGRDRALEAALAWIDSEHARGHKQSIGRLK